MGWFERMISLDGRLHGKARSNRRLVFCIASVMIVVQGAMLMMPPSWPTSSISLVVFLVCQMVIIVMCVCRVHLTDNILRAYSVSLAIAVAIVDVNLRSISSPPAWPAFVLVADLSLITGLGGRFSTGIMVFAALWLVFTSAEQVLRFGLLDLPGSAPDSLRWDRLQRTVSCTDPPCPVSATKGIYELQLSLLILLIDFAATRGFADAAEKEQAAMARTIETVEAIAKLLAGYDVDTVAEMLEEAEAEGRLPAAMHGALRRLERNLRAYRPYLPAVLLEEQHLPDGSGSPRVSISRAPGIRSDCATIAFTDIRASTSIWEAAPEAMKPAIRIHNAVIRSVVSTWSGYEVKTIGDAFMVAFSESYEGVCFGLAVQEALLAAEWPAALLEVPLCRRTGLWGGLTVRVGVNEGPVTLETNTVTGRVDYFGHTVNVAARLEFICIPGAVEVPAELWATVRSMPACLRAYTGDEVPTNLKGVSEPLTVCSLWPACLKGRQCSPLHGSAWRAPSSVSSKASVGPPDSPRRALVRSTTRQKATVAFATLSSSAMSEVDSGLAGVMPLLEQSDGVLLALVGNNFFTGWNVGKYKSTHEENALRFAQRVLQQGGGQAMATLGIASGPVEHGVVGTALQRFVTASGGAVEASLALRRLAMSMHMRCLYTAEAPPGALRDLLRATTVCVPDANASVGTVYQVVFDEGADE